MKEEEDKRKAEQQLPEMIRSRFGR